MLQLTNSDVVGHVLKTILNISSRKSTEGHAVSTMTSLLRRLEDQYDFLKHVDIKDTRFQETSDTITVMNDMDTISPQDVGKALSSFITMMDRSLGKDAGHFFIKEIRSRLDEDYYSTIQEMGVDLSLMQLEHEVTEWEQNL